MKPHPVEWSDEKVAGFWQLNHASFSRRRYSQQVGPALAKLVRRHVSSGSLILDYGCGNGDLLRILDGTRYLLFGTDYQMPPDFTQCVSPVRRESIPSGTRSFLSVSQLEDLKDSVDAVLLIEVVEHLEDPVLDRIFGTIHNILKPNGKVIVTTPNCEDLVYNTVNCPDCGCIFHRVQHVRSWTAASLSARLSGYGLLPTNLVETDLGRLQRSPVSRFIRTALDRLDRRTEPHLVGVFQKPA